jgi:ABC-type Fe3+-hydroxamate transport system substrate-binding protein
LSTHGGSLRVYAQRSESGKHAIGGNVASLLSREEKAGITSQLFYANFQTKTDKVKNDLISFLLETKSSGKRIAGYGAAAKGNTLLNYAGIRPDLLPFVVDRNPSKQNKFLPGCRIPIVSEEEIKRTKPDYVIILPWNLREEVMQQLSYIRAWGGQFVTAVPAMSVF